MKYVIFILSKKYSKIILELKNRYVEGKTIIEYETALSKYNRKTLDFNNFLEYIKHKNKLNRLLVSFYSDFIFRKLKLNGYLNRKKNEYKMINRFEKLFGSPEETIVCFGDYKQKRHSLILG